MIRETLRNEILRTLNHHPFSHSDFEMVTSNSYGGSVGVKIIYRYKNSYIFSFNLSKSENKQIKVDRNPGILIENQTVTLNDKDEILAEIIDWISAIKEDMYSSPIAKEFEETREKIFNMEEKFAEIPDQYFTKEEGEVLKQHLEKVETEFEDKLKEEHENNANLELEIRAMKSEMEQLKIQVEVLTKRNWFKSFGTKLHGWGKTHPKTTAFLAAAGIQFLPQEIKDFIPHEELINILLPEATTETPKLVESKEKEKITNQ
jgi:hypothetical protein